MNFKQQFDDCFVERRWQVTRDAQLTQPSALDPRASASNKLVCGYGLVKLAGYAARQLGRWLLGEVGFQREAILFLES